MNSLARALGALLVASSLGGCALFSPPAPEPTLVPVAAPAAPPSFPGECKRSVEPFAKVPVKAGEKLVGAPAVMQTLERGRRQYDKLAADHAVCKAAVEAVEKPADKPGS